jgi:hypothetical protein
MGSKAFIDWSFNHYLNIAPPSFATAGAPRPPLGRREPARERAAA